MDVVILVFISVSDPETRVEMEIVDMNIDCREGLVMVSFFSVTRDCGSTRS